MEGQQSQEQKSQQSQERKPLSYQDFNLRFAGYEEADGVGTFKVWVEGEAPGGSMKPDDAARCTYKPEDFLGDPAQHTRGLLNALENRRKPFSEDDLFKLGEILSNLALPSGPVRDLFDRSKDKLQSGEGLRIRLKIDSVQLQQLPWEFMMIPPASGEPQATDFLALCSKISIVRTDSIGSSVASISGDEKEVNPDPLDRGIAKIVGVLSSPEKDSGGMRSLKELEVEKDKEAIENAIQKINEAAKAALIEATWVESPATREALQKVLSEAGEIDIFHYSGHGLFETASEGTSNGYLLLETEQNEYTIADRYSDQELAQLLQRFQVRLVFLGACNTGRRDGQNVWSGIAPSLTRQMIPAVIANQFTIKDQSAILLADRVYQMVLRGFTVDEALFEARQSIYQGLGLKMRDWGTPVLYLQGSDGVLFPLPKAKGVDRSAGSPFLKLVQSLEQISGKAVGVDVGTFKSGTADVNQTVTKVESGGEFIGVKIDTLG